MWSNIKLMLKNKFHQKMYILLPTFCWSMTTDHDEYVPTIINKQTSPDKPTSKLKLFKSSFTRST